MTEPTIRPDEDAWARLAPEIGRSIAELQRFVETPEISSRGFLALLEARYRQGESLYKREWLDWEDADRFEHELIQEVADAVLYIAMRRVRHPDQAAVA